MAFCFPGTNPKGGDYPPPPRCARLWRPQLLAQLPAVELTLLVGSYAQAWAGANGAMSDIVGRWREFLPNCLPLPHPSWRNTAWLKRNPWFEEEVVPYLQARVTEMLA
jgi:uracil-DNA glycosylase